MTRVNDEILKKIKQLFDEKEYIVVNGFIYKKVKRYAFKMKDSNGIEKSIGLKRMILVIEYDNKWRPIDNLIYSAFKKSIEEGTHVIENDCIYRKFGGTHERGYKIFSIIIDGVTYNTFAHRIIYYLTYGTLELEDFKIIHHKDNKKQNNSPENLELITQFENVLLSIRNDEILIPLKFLDTRIRKKYNLNDEQWELFKAEVYKAHERHGEDFVYPL